jgi:hypothetical protein
MKFAFKAAAALAAVYATGVAAEEQECVCTGGCNAYGDPHVMGFLGYLKKLGSKVTTAPLYSQTNPQDGEVWTLNIDISKFPRGDYITKLYTSLDGKQDQVFADVAACEGKPGTKIDFETSIDFPVEGFESQKINGYVQCSVPNGSCQKNYTDTDNCPVFFNVWTNFEDTLKVDSSVAQGMDFFTLQQNTLQATGKCMIDDTNGVLVDNRYTPAQQNCVCKTVPTPAPTEPFRQPTAAPTKRATDAPTAAPTKKASDSPTAAPTKKASDSPTAAPTKYCPPSCFPTPKPTLSPVSGPTDAPTMAPTAENPTMQPTGAPTEYCPPECHQSKSPTSAPSTPAPTEPFKQPTAAPTPRQPFNQPTVAPTVTKQCKCTGNCRAWRDPHVETFDGSKFKTDVAGTNMTIYGAENFELTAWVPDSDEYQMVIYQNGAELMSAANDCPGNSKSFSATVTSSTGVQGDISWTVTCNSKHGVNFLDVTLTKVNTFSSNMVSDPSNFMTIETDTFQATGECMRSEAPPSKAPWTCTC